MTHREVTPMSDRKATRRPRREGGVRQRHAENCRTRQGGRCNCNGRWAWRLKGVERGGFTTKAEAERALAERLREGERGVRLDEGRVAFDAYARAWLEGRRVELRPGTFASYAGAVEAACSYFGAVPLGRVTPQQVRGFRDALARDRGAATVGNQLGVLRNLLGRAVEEEHLA